MKTIRKALSIIIVITIIVTNIICVRAESDQITEFVERLYEVTLGRDPDEKGLSSWCSKLKNGEYTGVATAYGFIMSPEFQNKGYSNSEYIDLMYKAFFGRVPDAAGKEAWVRQLNSGISKEEIFCGFANSEEFFNLCRRYGVVAGTYNIGADVDKTANINLFIQRLYRVFLNRDCDMSGMQAWTNQLLLGNEFGAGTAYGFIFSDEYRNLNKTDEEFVIDLYVGFLGREPDTEGKNAWINTIRCGYTDLDVFFGFAYSNEFNNICNLYGIKNEGYLVPTQNSARANKQFESTEEPSGSIYDNSNSENNNEPDGSIGNSTTDDSIEINTEIIEKGLQCLNYQLDASGYSCTNTLKSPINPTDYTYEVYPLIDNFNEFFYIKTENPDPWSFRLYDPESIYYGENECSKYITVITNLLPDVVYENPNTYRVQGGYIATSNDATIAVNGHIPLYDHHVDGGDLILQIAENYRICVLEQTFKDGSKEIQFSHINAYYRDTDIRVSTEGLVDEADYLINKYTSNGKNLFENLDSVQNALNQLAVYPRSICDDTMGAYYYPYYVVSPYEELSVLPITSIYASTWGRDLLTNAYPFVLDSLGFPNMISKVATRLDSRVYTTNGQYHYEIDIHYNGQIKTYGGAGVGSYNDVPVSRIEKLFKFDGTSSDYFSNGSLASYRSLYLHYSSIADEMNTEISDRLSSMTNGVFNGSNGGWVKVAAAHLIGTSVGHYAYIAPNIPNYMYFSLENVWVDGRYVNKYNIYEAMTFEESLKYNPDILCFDVTAISSSGKRINGNYIFSYIPGQDVWISRTLLTDMGIRSYSDYRVLPDTAVLTKEEVLSMNIDRNYNTSPEHGYIYDGTAEPGTPF